MSKRKKSSNNNIQTGQARSATSVPLKLSLSVPAGAAIIVLATFLAYLPSINGGFVFDDNLLLTKNDIIRNPDGLNKLWCTTESVDYWPVTNSTFWIEWRLWETNPMGYHITNLILHIVETLLIWFILRKLSVPGAFFAAIIFALHPVNVESVAWIAQRKNMMSMLFFLLSILWYLKADMATAIADMSLARSNGGPWELEKCAELVRRQTFDRRPLAAKLSEVRRPLLAFSSFILHPSSFYYWYWLSLVAFALAMLSKASAVVLPMLLLGILWWLRSLTRRDLLRIAPFFLLAVALTGVNIWFQTHGKDIELRNVGFVERLLGAGGVVWFYLYKALLPIDLAFIYPQWRIETGNPLWWLPLLAAILLTAVLWLYRKGWSRPLLFAWGFFCVSLVPVLGFTDVGFMRYSLVADHYQHIAIIWVIALAAAGWGIWHQRARNGSRWVSIAVAVAAMVALAFLTWRQSGIYHDAIGLYQETLEKNPDSWLAHNNLGLVLADAGQTQEAVGHFRQALRLYPNYTEAHLNMGTALANAGRLQEAIEHFRQALRLNPDYTEAHNNLGNALANAGRLQEAIEHYQQALRLKPGYANAHNNLGAALVDAGRPQEAIEHYRQALRLNPDYVEAHNNLGAALANTGRLQEAIDHYQRALRLKPNYANAHNNLGDALFNTGRFPEAIKHYQQTLRLKPNLTNTYFNLALSYARMQQSSEAVAAAKKALELARSQGLGVQAKQYEDWLNAYRAGLQDHPNPPPPSKSIAPPP